MPRDFEQTYKGIIRATLELSGNVDGESRGEAELALLEILDRAKTVLSSRRGRGETLTIEEVRGVAEVVFLEPVEVKDA